MKPCVFPAKPVSAKTAIQPMAKKKTKPASQTPALSDKSYLTSGRARKLPIYKCMVNHDWKETGMAQVYVLRKHVNGNVTVGIYLADLLCAGVKSAFYLFNITESKFNELVSNAPLTFETCSYELAHNIIYGSIAFAEEYGIEPTPEFKLARLILEEDTEDIPLIELEFGRDGKPLLVINEQHPRNDYYLRQLEKNAGPGNYEVIYGSGVEDDWDEEDDELYDDLAEVEKWDRTDWETYLNQPSQHKDPDFLIASLFIFEQAYPISREDEPIVYALLHPRPFEITYDALPYDFYTFSEEELQEIEKLHPLIKDLKTSNSQLKKVRDQLLQLIAQWPGNPTFRNFLANTYIRLNEKELADKTIIETFEQLPEYFHAKIQYAQLLTRTGQPEKVMALFNHKYTLPDLFPERNVFHYSEAISFYSTMMDLFLIQGELYLAFAYYNLFRAIAFTKDEELQKTPILELNLRVIAEADKIVAQAKQTPEGIENLIDALLQPQRLAAVYEL
jgi:hypothetical protein